jgi:hypothetical protein
LRPAKADLIEIQIGVVRADVMEDAGDDAADAAFERRPELESSWSAADLCDHWAASPCFIDDESGVHRKANDNSKERGYEADRTYRRGDAKERCDVLPPPQGLQPPIGGMCVAEVPNQICS